MSTKSGRKEVVLERKQKDPIRCGPFDSQSAAQSFATALAHGGGLEWGTQVRIEPYKRVRRTTEVVT